MTAEALLRRIWISIALLSTIILIGWAGYVGIEGFSSVDAIFMTIITISTVGFQEVHPLDLAGKVFTIFIILAGTGTLFYVLLSVTEFAIEGHLTGILERRGMQRGIARMQDHFIVCGYGRVGEHIAQELRQAHLPFVVVEKDPERTTVLQALGVMHVEGDAADDHVLMAAGVKVAKGLVAAVDTDAENVFVTLSAKVLNPKLRVVARAVAYEAQDKLTRAGADKTVSTILIGARRMAQLLIYPEIADYLELISRTAAGEYRLAEFTISQSSELAGAILGETDVRGKTGALILAIKAKEGQINNNPPPTASLRAGDHLIVLGTDEQLKALRRIL